MNNKHDLRSFEGEIAVVGIAGRFPGAKNIAEFWNNIRDGQESITRFTEEDLRQAGVRENHLTNPNYVRCAPILEDMECFDAEFFGISPRDAAIMDPQHRLFLESAWGALEHAGHPPETFDGNIAVFAGAGAQSYLIHNVLTHSSLVESVGSFLVQYTGNEKDVLASRVSYQFDLTGPSITVQTACSTSLVAVHLACQSLLNGECDMALAGGVTIWVPHYTGYRYREGEIRSPDGRCRPFDAAANGTTFGSGVGIVVLRRLTDALDDRDYIYGVIKGSAVNNDGGQKVGYFAPSVRGQALAIVEAVAAADVDPTSIDLLEAHGTGTRLGDPIEIAALSEAYRAYTHNKGYCAIGSVKSNIGHLDTASGVAGLIKTLQALVHKQLPPSLNFSAPNPEIDFPNSPFFANTQLLDWKTSASPRRAAVNSLGIGGTNAHVILEEAPQPPASGNSRDPQLLVLSAKNRSALDRAAQNLASHISQHPEVRLADIAYTLQIGRSEFDERRFVVCRDPEDAAKRLADRGRMHTQTAGSDQRIAFMFTGQGAQHVNMGRRLYKSERIFREQVDRCAGILTSPMGRDLRTILYPEGHNTDSAARTLQETATAQPVLFTIEYALASLWRHWGVEPQAMIGHSLGEYVAACLGGVFSLEDALALVTVRGRLMQDSAPGSMLAILRKQDEVRGWLSENVSLAAVNAPEVCVVSGRSDHIEALQNRLTKQGILCRPLPVRHAFHSPMMDPILSAFTDAVRSIRLSPPSIPFISDVTGDWITDQQAVDPAYWGSDHARKPVRFADGLQRVVGEKETVLIEIGPGTTLTALARRSSTPTTLPILVASLPNPADNTADVEFLLSSLGKVWSAGAKVDWNGFYADERRNRVPLPTYPFEPVRHWLDPAPAVQVEEHISAEPAKRPPLEDWFYQPSWKRTLPPVLEGSNGTSDRQSTVVVFADACGIGDSVASRIRERGHQVIVVRTARGSSQNGKDEFCIDPGSAADVNWLVDKLYQAERPPQYILHMWNVTLDASNLPEDDLTESEVDLSFFNIMYLAQSFAKRSRRETVHLKIVSSGMQQIAGEILSHPVKALLLGPCRVIPQELPRFNCCSVDIAPPGRESWQWNEFIELLAAEALSRSDDEVVAYRGGERMVETFDKVDLRCKGIRSPLRDQGTYLITGGLGGLGLVVADYLVKQVGANVVLTGRTQFPSSEQWDEWLTSHLPHDPTSTRIRRIRNIERSGGSITVLKADVCDPREIRDAVNEVQIRFGPLHGVYHLAGVLDDGLIELKTKDAAQNVLRPKVQGTLALLAALEGVPLDFIALFSSLSSIIGLDGQVDYAAANSFLNAFARHEKTLNGTRIVAIDWGMWEEFGIAAEHLQGTKETAVVPQPQEPQTQSKLFEVGVETHWVLNEHRRRDGLSVMPGTGYIELARSAFAGSREWVPLEIRDILFLAPMTFQGSARRNLRLELEGDKIASRFSFSSRPLNESSENGDWELHVTGGIAPIDTFENQTYDLDAIIKRCPDHAEFESRELDHHFWKFGPRWASLKEIRFGRAEALLVLEMPTEFVAELDESPLHPALLDMATGDLVTEFDKHRNLFVPFSYASIRAYRPLERLLYCHVRYRQSSFENSPVAAFDVTIANDRGEVLADVNDYLTRRADNQGVGFAGQPSKIQELPPVPGNRATPGRTNLPQLFRYGIQPAKGIEALERILGHPHISQIIVSPMDLKELLAANRTTLRTGETRSPAMPQAHDHAIETEESTSGPADVAGTIMSLWQETLGLDGIGENNDLFALGGNSLTMVQIAAQLRERFRLDLSLSDLMEQSTIAQWARVVQLALEADGRKKEQ